MRVMQVAFSVLLAHVHAAVEPGAAPPLSVSVEQAGSPTLQVGGHFDVDDAPLEAAAWCRKIVYCRGGMAYSNAGTFLGRDCEAECKGDCCVGYKACSSGTFAVCADGRGSCNGFRACDGVSGVGLGIISGGSCVGEAACHNAGASDGAVGSISYRSCVGDQACHGAGRDGAIGSISGRSCDGNYACYNAGKDGAVGNISGGSCQGEHACSSVGRGGVVGNISGKSCLSPSACLMVGSGGKVDGAVGNISDDSCIGIKACCYAGHAGRIGDIKGSCHGWSVCEDLLREQKWYLLTLDTCCIATNHKGLCSTPVGVRYPRQFLERTCFDIYPKTEPLPRGRIEPSNGLCVFELDRGNAPPCCAKWGFEKSGPGVVSWPFYGNNDQCSGGFIFQSDQEVLDEAGGGLACKGKGVCLTKGYYRKVMHSEGLRGEQFFLE